MELTHWTSNLSFFSFNFFNFWSTSPSVDSRAFSFELISDTLFSEIVFDNEIVHEIVIEYLINVILVCTYLLVSLSRLNPILQLLKFENTLNTKKMTWVLLNSFSEFNEVMIICKQEIEFSSVLSVLLKLKWYFLFLQMFCRIKYFPFPLQLTSLWYLYSCTLVEF